MVEKFIGRPYCYKILPLVYDDSISYYEFLCKILKKVNEIIEDLNQLWSEFNEFKTYVQNEINRIDEEIADIDNRLTALREEFDTFKSHVEDEINRLDAEDQRLDGKIDSVDDYYRGEVERIDDEIDTLATDLSNLANRVDTVEDTLNSLYLNDVYDSNTKTVTVTIASV